jgi:uncharacterized protein
LTFVPLKGTIVPELSTKAITEGPATALFPKTRRAVLALLYSHPDEVYYLRRIVDVTGLAMGQVQRELSLLCEAGIISRQESDRHVYFGADKRCPIYEELRGIVAKTMGAASVIREALGPLSSRIAVAFVYGSVARRDETSASDIDLMVTGEATFGEVAEAVRSMEARLCREVNVTVYPADELRAKALQGHHFIKQVLQQEKLFVIGGERELAALLE